LPPKLLAGFVDQPIRPRPDTPKTTRCFANIRRRRVPPFLGRQLELPPTSILRPVVSPRSPRGGIRELERDVSSSRPESRRRFPNGKQCEARLGLESARPRSSKNSVDDLV